MYIHQLYMSSYSPSDALSGNFTVRNDSSEIKINLTLEESLEITSILELAYSRKQARLVSEASAPLQTNLLAAPIPEADYSEVPF